MNHFLLAIALCASHAAALAAPPAADLARSKNCLACHGVNKKIVGPALSDIAKKYAGQAGAESLLAQKVLRGSSGVWGSAAMPANQVTDDEALALVKWVLSHPAAS